MDIEKYQSEIEKLGDGVQLPGNIQPLFDAFLAACRWRSEDGPLAGVFAGRRPGHRVLWSCVWTTSAGVYHPDRLLPLEFATPEQMIWEAADYLTRQPGPATLALTGLVVDYFLTAGTPPSMWLANMRAGLATARMGYPEFSGPGGFVPLIAGNDASGAGRLLMVRVRPGWDSKEELLRFATGG